MEYIVIDDNLSFAGGLSDALQVGPDTCSTIDPRTVDEVGLLADHIITKISDNSILLLNANLIVGKVHRQADQGTTLLTWLRIKGVMHHAVLYSFQSAETLVRRNPKNILLLSKGTSFIRLPCDLVGFVQRMTVIKADANHLKSSLRAIFNIAQFRHRDANWWSVKVLWDVHKVAKGGKFKAAYPDSVKTKLSNLNNAVGAYLHGLEVADVTRFFEEKKSQFAALQVELAERKADLEKVHIAKQEDQQFWEQTRNEISNHISENQKAQLYARGDAYEDMCRENEALRQEEAAALLEHDKAEQERDQISQELLRISKKIDKLQIQLSSFSSTAKDILFQPSLPHSKKSRILLIDDNARNGWEDIFRTMLNADVDSFVPPPEYKHDIAGLYNVLQDKIKALYRQNLPSMIFLDLRLYDETVRSIDIEGISGTQLLGKIRRDFRTIPIVMTTASNKVWTFRRLIQLGADAYWVKEGMDEFRGAEDSVRNYSRLVFLVNRIADGHYQLLEDISAFAQAFDKVKWKHWSRSVVWRNGESATGRVDAISKALNDSVQVIKNYLHTHHLEYGYNNTSNEAFILSGVINKMAGVYESVHGLRNYADGQFLIDVRGDARLGARNGIKWYRNEFSHFRWEQATWPDLEGCFVATKEYLNQSQP